MYDEKELEGMTTEEITERIDKEICSIADTFKDESKWKERMMSIHHKTLKEDSFIWKGVRCAAIRLELMILKIRIEELSQLISEENDRTSKDK